MNLQDKNEKFLKDILLTDDGRGKEYKEACSQELLTRACNKVAIAMADITQKNNQESGELISALFKELNITPETIKKHLTFNKILV